MGLNLSIGVLCLSIVISTSLMAIEQTKSQLLNVADGGTSPSKLRLVRNRVDLMQLSGQEVKLVGYYVSQSWKPGINANTVEFKGEYHASQIVLEDGTLISIFPPGQKQSLRSSDEATTYRGKIVEAIGMIKFEEISDKNARSGGSFINLKKLKLV